MIEILGKYFSREQINRIQQRFSDGDYTHLTERQEMQLDTLLMKYEQFGLQMVINPSITQFFKELSQG